MKLNRLPVTIANVLIIMCLLSLTPGDILAKNDPAPRISIEDFFRKPQQAGHSLSPDGTLYAFRASVDGVSNILLKEIGATDPVQLTHSTERDIMSFYWGNKNHILYRQDNEGDENYSLYSVNIESKKIKCLTCFKNSNTTIIDLHAKVPEEVIIGLNKREPQFSDVYWLNIETGELRLVQKNPGNVRNWMVDNDGVVRIAYAEDVLYRNDMESEFEKLNRREGATYLYDHKDDNLRKIGEATPWLNEDDMAEMRPIEFNSRDGLAIHGYLTIPRGIEAKNLPLIVNPHAGPQWGLKMQDDISDGVYWLIGQGIADKDRIAIFGWSFGGYAALARLAFTPDLYACGIDFWGVSNYFTFYNNFPPQWKPFMGEINRRWGDAVADAVQMRQTSPVFHAANIKAPVFIGHSANDSFWPISLNSKFSSPERPGIASYVSGSGRTWNYLSLKSDTE